jgi:CHAD domain-containing protein
MSFELRSDESLRKGVRRIVRKQLENALELLTGKDEEPHDEVVHDARKCFKKVRAVLRLVRPVIGAQTYRTENTCFRDAARPLTEVRDARILVETLDGLVEHFKEHIAGRAFNDVRQALQDNLRAVRARVLDEQNTFTVVAEVIRQGLDRVRGWTNVPKRWSSIGQGLEDTYRRGAAAFEEAVADTTVETLHEWRKQVKYLRYQLEVLRPVWPPRLEELAGEADRMGDLLGDDHDLTVLRQMLTDEPDRFGDQGDRSVLLALIDRRRNELEQEAMLLGARFFQERPRDLTGRLKAYWKTWGAESGLEQPVG